MIDMKANWANDKCDKYDYLIAAFCGATAGLVDVFFVGAPGQTKLGGFSDAATDEIVKKFAKMLGWSPRAGNEGNVGSAIGFLELKFKVNYENSSTKSVNGLFQMSTKNHHYKSLAHSPDIVGLFFSILDQFTNTASFLSDGQLIRIDTSDSNFELRGSNFVSKLFCGFCNWIGHIMSDVAGSSGGRGKGLSGRGTGLPLPFSELFLLGNFGGFQVGKDRQTLAVIMTRAFQEGYDARFGAAMAIPVFLEELMIRVIWAIKRHFYSKKDWEECIPTNEHPDLRIMLIVGNATLCLIDGADAAIRSGGNALIFVLHMNLVAWTRLLLLVFRELRIRYGPAIDEAVGNFLGSLGFSEKYALKQYYQRLNLLNKQMEEQLKRFIDGVEKEYKEFVAGVEYVMIAENGTPAERMKKSCEIAEHYGVPLNRIMHSTAELDAWVKG
ncbi:MAG: hypothetical protein PHF29_06375 [Candidatus Riflebacteria bacterium]|nr:hypothetical protein [Candidatus Riflebacteria bacterium]